jgi:plastocyanin
MNGTRWMKAAFGATSISAMIVFMPVFGHAAWADDAAAPSFVGSGRVISISAAGYGTDNLRVGVGETVSFFNTDNAPHQVVVSLGDDSACGDLVIYPQVYRSCTFTRIGVYTLSDGTSVRNPARGMITVVSPDAVLSAIDLEMSRGPLRDRAHVVLSGSVNLAQAGIQVDIIASTHVRGSYRKIGQTRTTSSGQFSFVASPDRTTLYFANAIQGTTIVTSSYVAVDVGSG